MLMNNNGTYVVHSERTTLNGGELRFGVSTRESIEGHVGVVYFGGVEVYSTATSFDLADDAYVAARWHVIKKFAELAK